MWAWHYQSKRGAVSPAVACVKPESKFCVNVASDSHSNCCMVNEALCECGIVLVVGGSVNVMAWMWWLIFFLQQMTTVFQVRPVFSEPWPTAGTYRSEPYLSRLACATAPFGPLVFQKLLTWMNVSCVSVHARCIVWHKTGAYALEIRWRTVSPRTSHFGLSNTIIKGCVLKPAREFSSAPWPNF